MFKIALVRSTSYKVKNSQYNVQEIGLANELSKLGMEVDVYIFSDTGETYIEKCGKEDRVTVYWMKGIPIPGRQAYYKELNKFLSANKYDLVWALDDSQLTTVLVSKYCKKNKIKFVLWQGMYENYPEKWKRILQYVFDFTLLKTLRSNTKYTISKTTSAQKYLVDKNFPKGCVIPVGLDVKNFQNSVSIDFRKKLNIPKNIKILLYVGKVEERRKPIFCMDVFKRVQAKYNNVCLVYVGNGPMKDEVHDYVENNKISNVFFIDKIAQKELPSLYKESELFILPTKYEIFGMVLMEAMYFGTPVITYKAAGPIDVISNGQDGIIMDNFNIDDWAGKIIRYLENDEKKTKGIKCEEKIKEKYLWNNVAKNYFEELERIIKINENK